NHRTHVRHLLELLLARFHQRLQGAEVRCQGARSRLAYLSNTEGIKKTGECRFLALLQRLHELLGRLLAHALQLRQLSDVQEIKIGRRLDELPLDQLVDDLGAEPVYIHRSAGSEVTK